MIVVGKFTVLSDAINVVGGILFLLSGTYLLFKLWNKRNIFFILLAIFCLLLGTSGIIFPFGEIWTFEWWSWHVLRVIAYIILLGYAMYLFSETTKQTIKISENLKTKNNHITDLLESVKNSVNVLVSSSIEIQATATQVSSGVSETATAISQTTATVKEVKLSSLESEKKATNVLDSAEEVLNASDSGTMAVQAIIIGMEQINKSMNSITEKIGVMQYNSQSIGEIITSVSDIAKQSKILSINAEIEAAKAGEHGVGFMVVANEIKSMADQSSQSTKEIIKILDDIQKATTSAVVASKQGTKSVEDGIKQTNNAGNAIQKLTESGQKALQAASQIVASSNQQVVGMNQIDNAMQNIYQAGMDNEKSMFQTESAARELNELSETLKKLLEKYDELND
jgi:methyl-accepting chemotaxis protein